VLGEAGGKNSGKNLRLLSKLVGTARRVGEGEGGGTGKTTDTGKGEA